MELDRKTGPDSQPDEIYRDLPDYPAPPPAQPKTVAISGSTGFIGSTLVTFLKSEGYRVLRLVRSRTAGAPSDSIYWNPAKGEIDSESLEGIDYVVHLAGENLGGGLWTRERKRKIMESREKGTRLLSKTLSELDRKPKVLVCASAVGYYGDRGSEPLDEGSKPGTGFLAEVCRAWEKACNPAEEAGIRVVNARFGIALSPEGGVLRTMLLPFKLGLGATLGQGKQYISWVSLDDLVRAVHHLLVQNDLSGPVNVTAPAPLTNRDFSRTIARALHRPLVFRFPAPLLRMTLGEMAEEMLLASVRVTPRRLLDSGFVFHFPHLEQAMIHLTDKTLEHQKT